MLFFWLACPGCGRHFDFHLGDYDFYPFLGPPRYLCLKCGAVYRSDRSEWVELSLINKLLWFVCSVLLVAGTGLLGGISVMVARQLLSGGRPYALDVPPHQDPTFLIAFTGWAMLTLVLQSRRLVASRRRSAVAAGAPFPATFFNLQVSLAPKYMVGYLLPPLACGVYYLVNGT